MKKSPLILMFFCTAFTWSPGAQATETKTDDPWKTESHFKTQNFETPSSNDGLLDFDDYDATMDSLNTEDQQAERKINELYTPVDIYYATHQASHLPPVSQPILENVVPLTLNRPDEDDSILQKILAYSIKTEDLEQTQRKLDTTKEEDIRLNDKVGELTGIVEKLTESVEKLTEIVKERLADEAEAWKVYSPLLDSDANIEDHEEKIRHEKEKDAASAKWIELLRLHQAAETELKDRKAELEEREAELKEVEAKESSMGKQHHDLSEKLESLKKETNELGASLENLDK